MAGRWVRLPRSGVPYYVPGGNPLPPGATVLDGPPAGGGGQGEGTATDPLLSLSVPEIVGRLDDADVDTIERLLAEEHAGAARKGLLDQLQRMRDNLAGQTEG